MRLAAATTLLFLSLSCWAQSNGPTKLMCQGKLLVFKDVPAKEIPVDGILVEVFENSVTVRGAPYLSANYSISQKQNLGILFEASGDAMYNGSLSRYGGRLILKHEIERHSDGSSKLSEFVSADCTPAPKPMF